MVCITPMAYHGIFSLARQVFFFVPGKLQEKMHVSNPVPWTASKRYFAYRLMAALSVICYYRGFSPKIISSRHTLRVVQLSSQPVEELRLDERQRFTVRTRKRARNRLRYLLILTQAKRILV